MHGINMAQGVGEILYSICDLGWKKGIREVTSVYCSQNNLNVTFWFSFTETLVVSGIDKLEENFDACNSLRSKKCELTRQLLMILVDLLQLPELIWCS